MEVKTKYYKKELKNMQLEGKLEELLKKIETANTIKYEIQEFFSILDNSYYDDKPTYKKEELYKCGLIDTFDLFDHILSLYIGDEYLFGNFPLFLIYAARKYEIPKYKDISFEEMFKILLDNIDLKKIYYNDYYRKQMIMPQPKKKEKYANGKTKYDIYHDIRIEEVDCYDATAFSVAAEEDIFNEEFNYHCFIPESKVRHTSKELGDGFGYDVFLYDAEENKEKLIEVKSTRTWNFELTENEIKVMRNTRNQPNTDYYLYIYDSVPERNDMYRLILKYNKEKDLFDTISAEKILENKKRIIRAIDFTKPEELYRKEYSIGEFVRRENNRQLVRTN